MASLPLTLTANGCCARPITADATAQGPRMPPPPICSDDRMGLPVDAEGRLVIFAGDAAHSGLAAWRALRFERDGNTVRLHRPLNHLAKVYIEPTNACNLDCVTCLRNAGICPIGRMTEDTFASILDGSGRNRPAAHGLLWRHRRADVSSAHGRLDCAGQAIGRAGRD